MKTLLQDIRDGLRVLFKDPVFAVATLLTIALGIGANTSIFSVVNAVLLKPLPFRDPSALVLLQEALPEVGFPQMGFSAPDLKIVESHQRSFAAIGVFQSIQADLAGQGSPERVAGARVSTGLFPLFGVQPILGRNFRESEDVPGHGVVILSYGLWQRRFGGDRAVIGRTIRLDRHSAEVVGVMPAGFQFPLRGLPFNDTPAELWVPVAFTPIELQSQGSMYNNGVIGRLKAGVSHAQAQAEADSLARQIEDGYPAPLREALGGAKLHLPLKPLQEVVVGEVKTPLLVLLGAVGVVLLIGCANVANLLLARAAARRKEIAVRGALGASPVRLIRQMLTEGLVVALLGGVLGVLLAWAGTDVLLALLPFNLPRTREIGIDGTVLLYTLAISILTAVLFGLAPGLSAARVNLQQSLQEGGRGGVSRARRRLHSAFVVVQIGLALVLLVAAGLLVRSFLRLLDTDPGFRAEKVLAFKVTLPINAYPDAARIRAFYDRGLERLQALPGVTAVAAASTLPLETREVRACQVEGTTQGSGEAPPAIAEVWVHGDYFSALKIPLLRGRLFTPADRRGQLRVALVNETMARRLWPGQDPIGRRIRWHQEAPWMTVVGIVRDVKDGALHTSPRPHAYTPYAQEDDQFLEFPEVDLLRTLRFVVVSERDLGALLAEVRPVFRDLDPELAISDARPMTDRLAEIIAPQRFSMTLLVVFAGIALVLACVGIYGVMAYSVTQRTHEIGVRMALGARRGDVLRLVLGQAGRLVGLALLLGLAGAFAITRVMASLLYGITATDPLTFGIMVAILGGIALLAGYVPAWRASRVDPLVALRYE